MKGERFILWLLTGEVGGAGRAVLRAGACQDAANP
jgi:hypothetical protein